MSITDLIYDTDAFPQVLTNCHLVSSGRCVLISLYALLLYEWLILFNEELDLIHSQKRWSTVRVAYLCCRYYPLLCWPVLIWAFMTAHDFDVCTRVVRPLYVCLIPFQLSSQAVMIIRAWAFTGQRRAILYLICTAYAGLFAAEIWLFADVGTSVPRDSLHAILGNIGCVRAITRDTRIFSQKTGILFVSACVVDALCLLVMYLYCIKLRSTQGPLGQFFLIQGSGSFLALMIVHVVAATLAFRPTRFSGAVIIPIPLMLSNIVACRLILGLRHRAAKTAYTRSSGSHFTTIGIEFNSVKDLELWAPETEVIIPWRSSSPSTSEDSEPY